MKIRLPAGQCAVYDDNGRPVIRAVDVTTYRAIVRLRQFIDNRLQELEPSSAPSNSRCCGAPASRPG